MRKSMTNILIIVDRKGTNLFKLALRDLKP